MVESFPRPETPDSSPRVSLLLAAGERTRAGIWMGGAHSHTGQAIQLSDVEDAWVIDLAGDMPAAYREAAARWASHVFADLDQRPASLDAIVRTVAEAADAARSVAAPEHIYVVCQYGMNRSGLVAGLLLRELGMPGTEALETILRERPGALSNLTYRRIVETWRGL